MSRLTNRAVFNDVLLSEGESRAGLFGAGFGLEFLALALLIIIPMLVPQRLDLVQQRYWITPLETPPVVAWKPQPKPAPTVVKQPVVKQPPKIEEAVVPPPKPKIYNPVVSAPVAKPRTARDERAPDLPEVAKAFPEQLPSMGSSALPTLRKPREAVQTGGFGDPNGVKPNNNTNRNPNIAQLGAYDMPAGPGYGNGTGGAKGARGVVASAGFGNGVATGGQGGNRGSVKAGGFADESAAVAGPKPKAQVVSKTTPFEILFVPHPAYTDEARAKKIEGEVLLQVVLTASGQVEVQRVVQGLGYGLESSAEAAARQIRFRPAQEDGQPVDATAIVHITFQLAY